MQHNYECGNHLTHSRQDVMLAAKVSANHSKVDIYAKRCIHYILIRHLSHQEEERMGMVIYKPTAERSLSHTSGKKQVFFEGITYICDRGDQNRYFKPNHDVFLTPTKRL